MKYNKNEMCDNLLLNKNLKGKACRSYDGEVMPFLKLPPQNQNSCVTSKAKGPLSDTVIHFEPPEKFPATSRYTITSKERKLFP